MIRTSVVLAACAALTLSAPALAQTASTTSSKSTTSIVQTTKTAPTKAKGPATTAAKTVEGKACSAQADAKGLHGKARKKFRSACKEDAKGAANSTTPASTKKS